MKRTLLRFVGKNREFRAWLAGGRKNSPDYSNVIFLQKCELCGDLCAGDICKKCLPMYRRWNKKITAELAAEEKPFDPSIA